MNSPLSEMAVLGFEYGMSSADPRRLVVWEAQFGDFVNSAQVIVDQFIAGAESKWQRMSGLTLLLPHGYEGQGPEHSSARLERFLQLCAEDNMQVVNCTTPAQFFHVLRRQMHRQFRKPLIVMSPKSLLRHARAVSSLSDLTDGALPDRARRSASVRSDCGGTRADVFGQDLLRARHGREERARDNIAIVRLEQLYPFPEAELTEVLKRYPRAGEFCWVQEEPANQGARDFVELRIERLLPGRRRLAFVGRAEAASPATGSHKIHQTEENDIVEAALRRPRPARAKR